MPKRTKRKRAAKAVVDLGERLSAAVREHQAGNISAAAAQYSSMLESAPEQPTLRHFLGMAQIQLRQYAEGESNVKWALRSDPDYADAWNSLGNLYRLTGRPEEALEAYQAVIRLAPHIMVAWVNLGDLYRQTGNGAAARDALARAVTLMEADADCSVSLRCRLLTSLAALERLWGNWEEAARLLRNVIEMTPDDARARRDLIHALVRVERKEEALAMTREWLEREPDHMIAQRIFASLSGQNTPERVTDGEVVMLFDTFASHFDRQLADLHYRAPALLQDAVMRRLGAPLANLAVCDAGCGTGLCGPWLKGYATTLEGVDLSQGMLDLAGQRNLYDKLERSELTTWLASRSAAFGLIVGADVLCYFGDLQGFARAASGALGTDGLLAFTVEYDAEPREIGYHVQINGRYRHNESYVRRCLADAGLAGIETDLADLRLESGEPVRGLVVTARKP